MNDTVTALTAIGSGVVVQISDGMLATISAYVSIVCGVIVITRAFVQVADVVHKLIDRKITAREAEKKLHEIENELNGGDDNDPQ